MRREYDSVGFIEVPEDKLWGPQTQRALTHFAIGQRLWPKPFIHAFGKQKWAAALANIDLDALPHCSATMAESMVLACQEVSQGLLDQHFPLSIWQSGSGTQCHMNVNEVIANHANQKIGKAKEQKAVHPNDHVNCGQSSNDTVPTVMHLALVTLLHETFFPSLTKLMNAFAEKATAWMSIAKVGRTHLQHAISIKLGEEFLAFFHQLKTINDRIRYQSEWLLYLPQGGTAVGNGLNSHPNFKEHFFYHLSNLYPEFSFKAAKNAFAAQSSHDDLISLSGELNTLACILCKIGNDLRYMVSDDIQELIQPSNEPGSSIMPGKINPSQAEVLIMIAYQVMGMHHATTLGGIGHFQLNVAKPLIFQNLWDSITLLSEAMLCFCHYFVCRLEPNQENLRARVEKNYMDLTQLAPMLGYEAVAKLVDTLKKEGGSVQKIIKKYHKNQY